MIDYFRHNPWAIGNVIWALFFIWWVVSSIRNKPNRPNYRLPNGSKFRLWKRRDKLKK